MATTKGPTPGPSPGPAQEYIVRVPQNLTKKHSILKFHHSLKIDLTKSGPMRMGRQNNLKEYRQAHDMDVVPKFGAGSEFGREQREEARRKKYGIYRKKYNPEDQPWHMTLGEGKNGKKLKGVKEGGISENVSYYVFTQCPDGAFEAFPVEDWYHFTPEINYKVLTSEEAEEEFSRRDNTLNHFSIMVRNKMKRKDEEDEPEEKEKKGKKSKAKDGLLLTEEDEWAVLSDGDVEENSDEEGGKKEKKAKDKVKKKKKGSLKKNSDDEALEESDSFDEGDEVDYMTDSESNDEDMYKDENRDGKDNYKEQGVEDEEALKKLVESGDEEEEDEEKDKDLEDDADENEKEKKDDSDSESSESSDSDSDPEKDVSFSALFMQKKKDEKDKKKDDKKRVQESENRSRSATPTEEKTSKKRKNETDSPAAKKVKVEPILTPSASSSSLAAEGITEEAVRRYLLRKPMTTKDLVQKFKNTGLSKDQLVNSIAKILKRIDPEKTKIKDKLYLSIKKTE